MSKNIQSVQEVLRLKQGYLGYLFKRTFQAFFKFSGFFANHSDNLESARVINKTNKYLFKNQSVKKFLNTNYIVFWESFQTVLSDFL